MTFHESTLLTVLNIIYFVKLLQFIVGELFTMCFVVTTPSTVKLKMNWF